MSRVENHLPHAINVVPAPFFSDMPEQRWEGREHVPRSAEATVALLGMVRVNGFEVPILRRRFTDLIHDEDIPYDPDVIKIVSHETIAAAHRNHRPIDDLAYPYHILRDETGRVVGCGGFGMPQPTQPLRPPKLALTEADIATISDPGQWVNTANYPTRLYDPELVPSNGDLIDGKVYNPILDLPPATTAVDVSPDVTIDQRRSEQFGVPLLQVRPNYGSDGIRHLPEDRNTLHFVHPLALRHAALLGQSLRFCVVSGGLLRDSERGTVLGGTSIYAFDPDMLASDGM